MRITRREMLTAIGMGSAASAVGVLPRLVLADERAGYTRIAGSFDGNTQDKDDYVSVAMALALIGKANRQSRLVHLNINCNMDDGSIPIREEEMWDSVNAEYGPWNHSSLVYDCQNNLIGAISHLANEINVSSVNDKLAILASGPMHVIHAALGKAIRAQHKYCAIVTHSDWNNNRGRNDLNTIRRDFNFKNILQLPDQNNKLNTGRNFAPYYPLRDSTDPRINYIFQRMLDIGKADPSDAGKYYYALTGVKAPTPKQLCDFLTN